jgi:hypothetical protein
MSGKQGKAGAAGKGKKSGKGGAEEKREDVLQAVVGDYSTLRLHASLTLFVFILDTGRFFPR